MRHRMAIAVLALVGLLVSTYLLLYKLGVVGTLVCGESGGCERVATSQWAVLFGVPVAAYGVAGYLVMLWVALFGLGERWLLRAEPTRWLVVLSGIGVLFAIYLTYLEAAVIHAWCRWCVTSAIVITLIFATSLVGVRGFRTAPAP
jgi:uncharacterized membrane protein